VPRALKALLIEDDVAYASMLRAQLSNEGMEAVLHLTTTGSLASALELVAGASPDAFDAIVADLNLPDSDGLRTVKRLRESISLPIIVLTGRTERMLAYDAVADGAQDYLTKDGLTGEALYRSVRYAVERAGIEQRLREGDARLIAAEKMNALGRLAGGMAHDLNNTMTIMLGLCELVLSGARQDQKDDLRTVISVGQTATGIIQRLLAFNRRQVQPPTPVDPKEIIAHCADMLTSTLPRNVELKTTLTSQDVRMLVDQAQVEQAIINLVVNAVDAMPDGGAVTVASAVITACDGDQRDGVPLSPGTYLELTVEDTGEGLSEEVQARCFEPFFSTKEAEHGTGLGLASVYGVIKQHSGYAFAGNGDGGGARFVLLLPCVAESAASGRPVLSVVSDDTKPVVMIVEDDRALLALTTRVLRHAGYHVLTANCGVDARNVCQQVERIDLLLTDLIMPRTDPTELVEYLSGRHPGLRVLHMSGYPQSYMIDKGLLKLGSTFIQKPFSRAALLELVSTTLAA